MPGRLLADAAALWPMNSLANRIYDLSEHNNTGTLQGAAPSWSPGGKFGPAVVLNGIDNLIRAPSSLSFGDGSSDSPFTMVIWANSVDIASSEKNTLIEKYNDDDSGEFVWGFFSNNRLYAWLKDASTGGYIGRYVANVSNFVTNNKWHQFILSYNGSGLETGVKILIDNIRRDSDSMSGGSYVAMEPSARPLSIGGVNVGLGSSSWFNGLIDHAMIWKYVLIAYEKDLIYKNPFCMFPPDSVMPEFGISA